METIDPVIHRPKTYFEEVIGWIFLILGGFNVLSGLWNVIFSDNDELSVLMQDPEMAALMEVVPAFGKILSYLPQLNILSLLLAVLTVVFSAGLLKRFEWARIGTILIMVINFLTMIAGVYFVHLLGGDFRVFLISEVSESDMALVNGIITGVVIFADIIMLAFAGLYIWIAYRLSTEKVKMRFRGDFVSE